MGRRERVRGREGDVGKKEEEAGGTVHLHLVKNNGYQLGCPNSTKQKTATRLVFVRRFHKINREAR
jgi:hypothetical protein